MSKKIVIIKKDTSVETRTLTQAERDLKYEQLAEQHPNIELLYFNSFRDIETRELELTPSESSNITNVFIKECLKISDAVIDNTSELGVMTQLDYPITGYTQKGIPDRVYASNTPVKIIGLIPRSKLRFLHSVVNNLTTVEKMFISGNYGLFGSAGKYIIEDIIEDQSKKESPLMFTKDNQNEILKMIFNRYKQVFEFLNSTSVCFCAKYIYDMIEPITTNSAVKSGAVKNSLTENYKIVSAAVKDTSDKDFGKALSKIKPVLEEVIPFFNQYRFITFIDALGYLDLFYACKYNHENAMELLADYEEDIKQKYSITANRAKDRKQLLEMFHRDALSQSKFNGKKFHNLSKKEREIINSEIERLNRLANKASAFPQDILDALFSIDVKERIRAFELITRGKLSSKLGETDLKNIICEHKYFSLEKEASGIHITKVIKEVINKFSQYGGATDNDATITEEEAAYTGKHAYFCKLCGEELAPLEYDEVIDQSSVSIDNLTEIDQKIYFQISNIVTSNIIYQFVNPANIIRDINRIIRPFMISIEDRLRKVKSNSQDMINDNISVFSAIYTYAMLIQIMETNKNIKFVQPRKLQQKTGAAETGSSKALFNTAILLLYNNFSGVFTNLQITTDMVKRALVKAFMDVGKQEVSSVDPKLEAIKQIANDRFYQSVARMKNRNPLKIEDILGMSIDQITKLTSQNSIYDNINSTDGKNPVFDSLLFFNKIAFKTTAIPQSEMFDQMESMLQPMFAKQAERRKASLLVSSPMIVNKTMVSKIIYHRKTQNDRGFGKVSMLYDVDGKLLKWDRIITNKGEFDIGKLGDFKESADYEKLQILDYVCSRTGTRKSKINEAEVLKELKTIDELESFFNYYTFKCPVGDIHKWSTKDDNICEKCKIHADYFANKDKGFYNKWENVYKKDREKDVTKSGNFHHIYNKPIPAKQKPLEYNLQSNAINKIANFANIDINLLANLGLTESYSFDDIINKKINPIESETEFTNRALKLIDYYDMVIRLNNQLKFNKSRKLEPGLQEISDSAAKTDASDFRDIPVVAELKYDINNITPISLCNYVLTTLFDELIRLASTNNKYKNVMNAFVKLVISRIIESEKLYSKYSLAKLKEAKTAAVDNVELLDATDEVDEPASNEFGEGTLEDFSMEVADFDNELEANLESNDL